MTRILAYCETALQVRIASRLAQAAKNTAAFELLLGGWNDKIGQDAAAKQLALSTHHIEKPANFTALPPAAQMTAIRHAAAKTFADSEGILVVFQDQHIYSQATIQSARQYGWKVALVQDGFLDFDMARIPAARRHLWPLFKQLDQRGPSGKLSRIRNILYKELYFSHFFGHTRPDWTFVFGASLANRLKNQFGLDDASVFVSGPILASSRPHEAPRNIIDPKNPKALYLDQCFLRYKRMSRAGWDKEYIPLIRSLSVYNTNVKLHPSQTDAERDDIVRAIGAANRVLGKEPVSKNHLDTTDLAITATSSSFQECLINGIPVIFVNLRASLDHMPTMRHPLVRNVTSLDELHAVARSRLQTGAFEANIEGAPLSDYLNFDGGGAEMVMHHLCRAQ